MKSWTRVVDILIALVTPLSVAAIGYQVASAIVTLMLIVLLIARSSERASGAINDELTIKASDNGKANAETVYLEGYYVVRIPEQKDGSVFAVLCAGTDVILAQGKTYDHACECAVRKFAEA